MTLRRVILWLIIFLVVWTLITLVLMFVPSVEGQAQQPQQFEQFLRSVLEHPGSLTDVTLWLTDGEWIVPDNISYLGRDFLCWRSLNIEGEPDAESCAPLSAIQRITFQTPFDVGIPRRTQSVRP